METTYAGRVLDASLSTCASGATGSGWGGRVKAPVFGTLQGTGVSASGGTHRGMTATGTTPTFPTLIFANAIVSTVEDADFGAVDGAVGGTIPGPHTWSPPV